MLPDATVVRWKVRPMLIPAGDASIKGCLPCQRIYPIRELCLWTEPLQYICKLSANKLNVRAVSRYPKHGPLAKKDIEHLLDCSWVRVELDKIEATYLDMKLPHSEKKQFNGKPPEVTVRRRLMVPLTLTFLVLIGTFLYGGHKIRSQLVLSEIHHKYVGVQGLFNELLDHQAEFMSTTAVSLARKKDFQQVFLNGDRLQLQKISNPYLVQIAKRYGVTHFYFHDVKGINFLRVHKPEKFGDAIDRHVLQRAMTTGKVAYGLELGPLGTFTYRTVLPWAMEGRLIGYIELGQEINYILGKLSSITNVDYLLTIDKQLLDRSSWESGMKMLGRRADWDLLPTRVIIDQSLPGSQKFIDVKSFFYNPGVSDGFSEVRIDEQIYRIKGFPLFDAAARNVGDFVVMHDVTAENKTFRDFVLRIAFVSFVLCSALFAFAYGILGRMDKRLSATQGQLYDQIEKEKTVNELLESEVIERKNAELKLKKLNENLEERVTNRTVELQTLNRELEQAYLELKAKHSTILHQDKMACIGQLAAGVAHDINNPIGFVSNNLYELEDYLRDLGQFLAFQDQALQKLDHQGELKAQLQEMRQSLRIDAITSDIDEIIKESLEGTDRVIKIVQNLSSFSRIDDSEYKVANLKDCLESTINIIWNELRYKAEVICDFGNIPDIKCYPGQLNQVFMNLLLNAAQAIDDFGKITVHTWVDKSDVMVSIADTGSGIPEENLQRIFEPFFTTKEVGKGTGLGLSIIYDIIQRHHGEITVDSKIGKGTTFTIRLPVEVRDDQNSLC